MTGRASENPLVTDGGEEDTKVTDEKVVDPKITYGESEIPKLTTQVGTTNGSAIPNQAEFSLIVVLFALVVTLATHKN